MSVTLDKAPRTFTVLTQDTTVHAVLLTPAAEDERATLHFDAFENHCLDSHVVTAVDRFDAHAQVTYFLNHVVITLPELTAYCTGEVPGSGQR